MIIPAGAFSVLLAIFIAYLALSKNSSSAVRIAARIALIILALAVAVCSLLIVLFGAKTGEGTGPADIVTPVAAEDNNSLGLITIIIFALVFLLFAVLIIVSSIREQRRRAGMK